MAEPSLARQVADARKAAGLSQRALARIATCDPATISALENGGGTLASLRQVTAALSLQPSPYPSALSNKRQWLGIGTRRLSALAGISRPVLQSLEATGEGRVTTLEAVAAALSEPLRLSKIEPAWTSPLHIIAAVLTALGIERFDLDPASDDDVDSVPCARRFTPRDGGLWLAWNAAHVWCNPPYDDVPR